MSRVKAKLELFGAWELEEHITFANGNRRPTGAGPSGILIYDESGFMTVAINFADNSPGVFYGGAFSVADGVVTHHVSVSSDIGRIGKSMDRETDLQGSVLKLKAGNSFDGGEITWKRL